MREKGLAEFAAAATELAAEATFAWIGPPDDEDAAASAAYTNGIRFVDERTDMPAVYTALDVFVLASYREGFSRAAMEAGACGVPMVLTDIRGCREVGDDDIHLRLVPPYDGPGLAMGVHDMLANPALRARLGRAARLRALEAFDQRDVARVSLETYEAVGGRKGLDTVHARGDRDGRVTVLHVLPADLGRGAQVYAGQMREALASDPEQQHLVISLFEAPQAALRPDITLGVPSGFLRRAGLDPRAVLRLRRTIRGHNAELVVAHGGESLKYVVAAAGRTPTVYYKVGLSTDEITRSSRTRLYTALTKRVSRVVAVSDAIAEQAHDLLDVPLSRLSVIPNGRDANAYHPPIGDRRRAEPPLVLFVGQLEPGKRPGLFLDVVERLRARQLPFDAAMVGGGPQRAEIEGRAAALGVGMLGVRTDVADLLRRAAVVVLTSAAGTEGMPGVLIEAGLSGLPVVATPAAGVTDVVADGETGIVARSDRPQELADHVAVVLANTELRDSMGAAARRRCEAKFSLGATTAKWRELVADLAQREGAQSWAVPSVPWPR